MTEDWIIKGKPALVILHMQESIAGSLASGPIAQEVKDSDHLPRQQALLKAFREKNLPVIYVVFDQSKFSDWSVLGYGMMSKRPKPVFNPKMREVIPELAPHPGEPVLSNWIWGAFTNSGLEQELRSRGIGSVVFFGCAFNIAVYNATVQASDLWYPVIVPEDACVPTRSACKTPEMMKVREVFEQMLTRYALVTNSQDIIAHL